MKAASPARNETDPVIALPFALFGVLKRFVTRTDATTVEPALGFAGESLTALAVAAAFPPPPP